MAKRLTGVSKRWSASPKLRGVSIPLAALAIVVLIGFTYAVVHRYGRAVLKEPRISFVAPVVKVASHSEPSIEPAIRTSTAASKPPQAESEPEIRWIGKKLTPLSASPRPKTPVLVSSEAQVNSQPDGAQVRFDGNTDPVFVTPATVEAIPIGRHSVVFSKPGFVSQTVTLEVVAGVRSTLNVHLQPPKSIFMSPVLHPELLFFWTARVCP